MPTQRHLDPRAQAAIDHLRVNAPTYFGAICPRNLPAALPRRSQRHGWRDAVTVFLLCELVSVHRVERGKDPFWRGALYQINRGKLAREFGCEPDEVSAALSWLKCLGLVFVMRRTRIDDAGKPTGTEIFVAPRMDRIQQMQAWFADNGCPMSASKLMDSDPLQERLNSRSDGAEVALEDGSTPFEPGTYLNCAKRQQKLDAESGGETSAQRQSPVVNDDRRNRADDGGGEAADNISAQTPQHVPLRRGLSQAGPTAPMPTAVAHGPKEGSEDETCKHRVSIAPPARRSTQPEMPDDIEPDTKSIDAWRKACLFCALWAQAIVRRQHVSVCKPTRSDHKTAFHFFHDNPHANPFYAVAVAIVAWYVAGQEEEPDRWDKFYLCRKSLEIQAFIRGLTSGKLESQIGQSGWEINAFEDLRMVFTESELTSYGFTRIPILEIDPETLWEHQSGTPDFYRIRELPLPPEVAAASEVQQDPNNSTP